MATPPPFTRTATELQTLKHELQRLKVHLIAHLRSKGIPIVVPPPPSIITNGSITTVASEEETVDKTVGMERKMDNNIEEDNEAETESSEKSALLASDRNVSNVMAVELLPTSLQSASISSFSYNSKNSAIADQTDLSGNNKNISTSTSLLSHQHHDGNSSIYQQDSVRQRCSCCTQFMKYLSPCPININFCRRTRHTNDSNNNNDNNSINDDDDNDDEVVLKKWITTCYNYMFR